MIDDAYPPPPTAPAKFDLLYEAFIVPGVPPQAIIDVLADPEVSAFLTEERGRAQRDWPDLARYAVENERLRASRSQVDAVFIGDSITEIWRYADPAVFKDGIVNRGIGGQTTPQILLRFYADVVSLRPNYVHILAGINDINGNTGPNTPSDFRNNICSMADIARANGIGVLIGSLLPTECYQMMPEARPAQRIAQLNAWLRRFCEEHGFRFIDYSTALSDSGSGMTHAVSNDGLHPNRDGYALMTPLVLSVLAELHSLCPVGEGC